MSARGPGRGSSKLQVYLSESETSEFRTDQLYQQGLIAALVGRAAARGRKYVEIFGAGGDSLHMGAVPR